MKRFLFLLAALMLLLTGCVAGNDIVSVDQIDFRYEEETKTYDLYFALSDTAEEERMVPARVDVRIEDELGNVIYKGKSKIKPEDFNSYTNKKQEKHILARVSIPEDSLKPGKSVNGMVFFKVSHRFSFSLKDLTCAADYCLPLQEFQFECRELNQDFLVIDEFWHSEATYRVDQLSWKSDRHMGNMVSLTVLGQKVNGPTGTGADKIRYEITNEKGEKCQGGELYLGNYDGGDSFTAEIVSSNLIPGEKYYIAFLGQ